MAFITTPNTLANGTAVDATALNSNFQAHIDGLSDGTKDLNVNAVTVAADATINGNLSVPFGSATVAGDLTTSGELLGCRQHLCMTTAYQYLGQSTGVWFNAYSNYASNEASYVMNRAGSIVGYSIRVNTDSFIGSAVMTPHIMKNSSTQTVCTNINIPASGATSIYGTYARGAYTFVAGDRVGLWGKGVTSGNVLHNTVGYIEVVFDS